MHQDDVPPDVPRSPTGRVPQWVLDEAAGMPHEPTPWRAPTAPTPRRRWRGRRPTGTLLIVVLVAVPVVWLSTRTSPTVSSLTLPASPGWPPPGQGEGARPTAFPTPPVKAASPHHAFQRRQDDGTPVTWSPCRPVHYVVRAANAPPDGPAVVREAVAAVSKATGLVFLDDGPTSEDPTDDRELVMRERYGDRWAPVLIAWATPAEAPDLAGDVPGFAKVADVPTPSGDTTFVTGQVTIDAPTAREFMRHGRRALVRATLMHELGHLVGLDHVSDARQLMAPEAGPTTTFQAGDLTGLAVLVQGPCQPDV